MKATSLVFEARDNSRYMIWVLRDAQSLETGKELPHPIMGPTQDETKVLHLLKQARFTPNTQPVTL
jgi:hypothetical protein